MQYFLNEELPIMLFQRLKTFDPLTTKLALYLSVKKKKKKARLSLPLRTTLFRLSARV